MKGMNIIQLNTLHLNVIPLNGKEMPGEVVVGGGEVVPVPPTEPETPDVPDVPVEPTPTYTLSASVTNGKVSATRNGSAVNLPYTANEGDTIVLEVTPNDGYTFEGWNDGNTDNPRTITMTADVALSAQCVEVVQPPVGNYIQFEDKAVEAICVANWSSDGIGLTEEDAAKVTDIGTKFRGNTNITSFEEFKYFTGIKNLKTGNKYNRGCFRGCTNLAKLSFPPSLEYIEADTLRGVPAEMVIDLPNLQTVEWATFFDSAIVSIVNLGNVASLPFESNYNNVGFASHSEKLTFVELSDKTINIGNNAFYNCSALEKVICRASTPPTFGSDVFYGSNCPIYVPDASLEAYRTATNWNTYADRIHPLSEIEGSLVFYDKLVGDGTAYINTEYYPKGTDAFDYDVTPKTTNAKFVWGVKSNSISLGELLYTKDSSYFLYGPTAARDIGVANVGRLQRKLQVTLSDNGQYFRVISAGDTLVNLAQGTGNYFSATAENPLLLFACQQSAATGDYPDGRRCDGALWSFKITDIDGNTIMSLKPCTFAGEAGMWDEINGKFYGNAATSGEFSVAND